MCLIMQLSLVVSSIRTSYLSKVSNTLHIQSKSTSTIFAVVAAVVVGVVVAAVVVVGGGENVEQLC